MFLEEILQLCLDAFLRLVNTWPYPSFLYVPNFNLCGHIEVTKYIIETDGYSVRSVLRLLGMIIMVNCKEDNQND